MTVRTSLAIVLAAGEGTRMRSAHPKVLHAVAGRSLLAHVLAAIGEAGIGKIAVVVGPGQDAVAAEAKRVLPGAATFVQHERRGTAHAVLAAKPVLEEGADDILVFGGGTIPPDDIPGLKKAGVAAIFTPGAPAAAIVKTLRELLDRRAKASAA